MRGFPDEIDLFLDNHSVGIIMMNDDDDHPSHFMIQSGQQVWSAVVLPSFSESSLAAGLRGRACEPESSTAER